MGVGFGHGVQSVVDVVSQDDVLQAEVGRWAQGQVADYHAVGLASVLVQDYHVRQAFGLAEVHQVVDDVAASVDAFGVREED